MAGRVRRGAAAGVAVGVFALIVADLPGLSSSVWAPKMAVLMVLGAAGLPVLCMRATAGRKSAMGPPAIAALLFVAIAAVSTADSGAVVSAVVGLYNQGTGLVFVVALAGVWALGTLIDDHGRPLVEHAIVSGAVVNAVVAVAQQTVSLSSTVPAFGTHASGLLGNPIFLGAVCVAALALLGGRFVDEPRRWATPVVLVGIGIGASAERLPVLLMLGVFAAEVFVALWRGRLAGQPRRLARLIGFAGLAVAGWIVGSVLYPLAHGHGLFGSFAGGGGAGAIGYTAQSTVQSTFGDRLDIWRVAVTAVGKRPLFGFGPGQFRDATSGLVPLSLARSMGSTVFADGHNLFVEYATTTGLLGLAALVGWLVLAARRRRGRLVLMAAVLGIIGMAEPLNAVTTPLVFLGLGAAAIAPRPVTGSWSQRVRGALRALREPGGPSDRGGVPGGQGGRVAVVVCAGIAALVGLALVVGDVQYEQAVAHSAVGSQTAAIRFATSADHELFAWPDPQSLMAKAELIRNFGVTPAVAARAVPHAEQAVRRDPTDADLWGLLAETQMDAGDLRAAERSAENAVRLRPLDTSLLNTLGFIARRQGDTARARYWFGRSLAVVPDQPIVHDLALRGCVPSSVVGLLPAGERCP